ncbi:hypothetical protein HKBW3S47_01898 [Candidatus Hakubella thermalkaliphila]|uniref:Uncharacterized protein n=1 Tax=Candidatus Hakubella thermalkaliphila TaxID=2754717 RepID=A0A6V8Q5Z4_9ACTN|nr:hypothetical protein HKBW3S47_01898 [Candidatus Hakubella thermalkaliphila]
MTNHLANITGLASVSWVDHDKRNACEPGFILEKKTKLRKGPRMVFSSLNFPNFCSLSNASQILKSNSHIERFSFFYNLLCYSVIGHRGESCLSTFKPFQAFSAARRAFALKRLPCSRISVPHLIKLFRIILNSIGKSSDIVYPKIHANKFFNVFNIFFRNLNSLKKKKLPLPINEIRFPLDVGKIPGIVANKATSQSAIDRPDRSSIPLP